MECSCSVSRRRCSLQSFFDCFTPDFRISKTESGRVPADRGRARQGEAAQHADRLPELRLRVRSGQARDRAVDVAINRRRITVAFLVILGWAAVAHAEDVPIAPAGTRSLAEIPFKLVLPRGHLLGDWLGARTWLEDHGVYA